jgi:hypothetical protein
MFKNIVVIFLLILSSFSLAQSCYKTSILSPSPFMGNNDEIFKTSDGRLWQVKYEYQYMYEYYPNVDICNESRLIVNGKSINIVPVGSSRSKNNSNVTPTNYPVKVILKPSGCRDYFLADGDSGGIYLLEWYGGNDPSKGDSIVGELKSYGLKDVFYPDSGGSGRVYVDDFMLSRDRAIEKLREKCW